MILLLFSVRPENVLDQDWHCMIGKTIQKVDECSKLSHWHMPVVSACCDQLKNATHFTIYFVYFPSRKTILCQAAENTLINTTRKVKAFIFQGLPSLLQAVTKISTLYKFLKSRSEPDRRWQF